MSNTPSNRSPRFSIGSLRLPLVAMLGALTMGSGFGNPGCGSSNSGDGGSSYVPPACDSDCDAMAGTYRFSFQPGKAVEPGCEKLGLGLPKDVVLSRKDTKLEARMGGLTIEGDYYNYKSPAEIYLVREFEITLDNGEVHEVRVIIAGEFATVPANPQAPASFTGDYYVYRIGRGGDPEGVLTCSIDRDFTATR